MTDVLTVTDLCKHYVKKSVLGREKQRVRAVDGISFSLKHDETLALVGESGCGKTTAALVAMGLIMPTSGQVSFMGEDMGNVSAAKTKKLRPKLQMVFQDPAGALNPRMTVGDIMCEPYRIQKQPIDADKVIKLLERVGLSSDHIERFPHELSGGQKQRVVIARALALAPEVVVLDEPTSALDVNVQAQILNLLGKLRRELSLSYLFISHDLGVVRHICDRVAVMYLGKIVEMGRAEEVFSEPKHPYTEALFSAIPAIGDKDHEQIVLTGDLPSPARVPDGCRFHPRCWKKQNICTEKQPQLVQTGDQSVACWLADQGDG